MIETLKIKRLFIMAVAFTVIILTANYALLQHFMNYQMYSASIMNISGKQRMLAQRAAMWSENLVDATGTAEQRRAQDELRNTLDKLLGAHALLLDTHNPVTANAIKNEEIAQVYFGPPVNLDRQVLQFAIHINALLRAKSDSITRNNPHYRYVLEKGSNELIQGFDSAVEAYQHYNAHGLNLLYVLSVLLFIGALCTIGWLWWWVFRPMILGVHNALQLTKLQQKVAIAANEAENPEEGLQVAIDSVCEYMQWPVGHAFIYSDQHKALVGMDVWHTDSAIPCSEFKQASDQITFASGEDFVGEVFSDATPMWILDVSHSSVYQRKESARAAGLKAAFAFPVFVGRKAVAVMEFYASEAYIPSETLLQVMANIGKQLGQTIERAQFRERAKLLETVITSANDGIIITSANLDNPGPEIVYVNEAFCKISGYAPGEVIGHSPRFLQNEFTKRETLDAMRQALVEGKPFRNELLNSAKDGTHYWLDISIVPVKNEQGVLTHFAAIEHDITARKKQEMEHANMWIQLKRANLKAEAATKDLQASLEKAMEASKAKSDFLANMSHELRTPMNGVLGMAHLLADTTLNHEQEEYVSTINGSAENLLMLLNDILDFSKIEAGALSLEHIAFPLPTLLAQTANLLRPQADKKSISLYLEIEEECPTYIWGDSGRLRQIITNLLGNAIKFTDRGYVRLSTRKMDSGKHDMLHISVEDTGMGIPAHKLHEIFEKFTQGDASVTRKFGGTGLGLAITKHLVNLMGGEIGVESAEGKGSTFWCSIPYTLATKEDVQQVEHDEQIFNDHAAALRMPIEKAKALLVEDYQVNRVFAEKLLRKFGFTHIDWAENGVEAIQKYRTHPYDIIFMDCQMPELDGYQATQKIRMIEESTPLHTLIIAMTANAMMGDREKCLKAGMDAYLSKPLRAEHLKKILEQWFRLGDEQARIISRPDATTPPMMDAPVDLEQLRMFTGGDREEERQLAELFLQQANEMIALLQGNVDPDKSEAWKSAAHRFKGSSGNLGAMKLHHLCKRAEQHYEDEMAKKTEMLSAIRQETLRVQQFMQAGA